MKYYGTLITSLLLTTTLYTMSAKQHTSEYRFKTPEITYKKPGAAIDIDYRVPRLQAGEQGLIEINLLTPYTHGTLQIELKTKSPLILLEKSTMKQKIILGKEKIHTLKVSVMSEEKGKFYLYVLISTKEKGFRSYAIPIQVGEYRQLQKSTHIKRDQQGRAINIMPLTEIP